MHKEDELRPVDVALGLGVGGDAEGREVGGRGDVVVHGNLRETGHHSQYTVQRNNTL